MKFPDENTEIKLLNSSLGNDFLDMTSKVPATKSKTQVGLHQTKKLLHSQRNHQQSEKTTYKREKKYLQIISDK